MGFELGKATTFLKRSIPVGPAQGPQGKDPLAVPAFPSLARAFDSVGHDTALPPPRAAADVPAGADELRVPHHLPPVRHVLDGPVYLLASGPAAPLFLAESHQF